MKNSIFSQKLLVAIIYLSFLPYIGIYAQSKLSGFNQNADFFIENKGQVMDQNNTSRADILYYGDSKGLNFHLKKNGILFQINKISKWDINEDNSANTEIKKHPSEFLIQQIGLEFVNSNEQALIMPQNELNGYINFYNGTSSDGIRNVKKYENLQISEIYKGINLKWYFKEGELEYDFVIGPNENYKLIQFTINGSDQIEINDEGELEISIPLGKIIQKSPIAYQENNRIESRWVKNGDLFSFELGNYDSNKSLTIDPLIRTWGTYYGGDQNDVAHSTEIDPSGNIYIAGYTYSTSNVAISGAHQATIGGNQDGLITKFTSAGVPIWSTYYGGTGYDYIYSLACASDYSIYFGGGTSSPTGISTLNSQSTIGGNIDAFLAHFDQNGTRLWGTYFGGSSTDIGFGCCVDNGGNVYLTGQTGSTDSIYFSTGYQSALGGSSDAFLACFDASSGNINWGTYFGAGTYKTSKGTCCAAGLLGTNLYGDIYIGGFTNSPTFPVNVHQTTHGGGDDAFLARFSSNGTFQWSTYYGGSGNESGNSITIDSFDVNSNNIYLAGKSSSDNNIATNGVYSNSRSGDFDAFLAKFNSSGVRAWGTYFGGPGEDCGLDCAAGKKQTIFLGGQTKSSSGISQPGNHQTIFGGGGVFDGFISEFNIDSGTIGCMATYYGGSFEDDIFSLTFKDTSPDNLVIAGCTYSNNSITVNGYDISLNNSTVNSDAFLVSFNECIDTLAVTGCDSFVFYNSVFHQSGNYMVYNFGPCTGCDSILLILTISSPSYTEIYDTACSQYSWNNWPIPCFFSGDYVVTLDNQNGCDSIVTLHLTILPPNAGPDINICTGSNAYMSASPIASSGTGTWSLASGSSGTFANVNSPTTLVTNIPIGTQTYIWTVVYGSDTCIDSVTVYSPLAPPYNLSFNVNTATLSWQCAVAPDTFRIKICKDCNQNDPDCLNYLVDGFTSGSWQVPLNDFPGCEDYCIDIRSQCHDDSTGVIEGASDWASAGTGNVWFTNPYHNCTAVKDFIITYTNTSCDYLIDWSDSIGCINADEYRVRYQLTSGGPVNFTSFTTSKTQTIPLAINSSYNIRVQTWCNYLLAASYGKSFSTGNPCTRFAGTSNSEKIYNSFSLYPNPTNGKVNISCSVEKGGSFQILVKDLSGKIQFSQNINLLEGENTIELNLNTLSKGLYLISLEGEDYSFLEKLILN